MTSIRIEGDGIAGLTLALRLSGRRRAVHVVPGADHRPPTETFTLPAPYRDLFLKTGGALESTIELIPVQADLGIDRATPLMRRAAVMWDEVRKGPIPVDATLRSHLRRASDVEREMLRSTAERLSLRFRDAPAALIVLPYLEATFGVWRFQGGMAAFAEVLRTRCSERGVIFSDIADADRHFTEADVLTPYLPLVRPVSRWWRGQRTMGDPFALGLPFIGMGANAVKLNA